MHLVWRSEDEDRDLDVVLPPGATVADLLAAISGVSDASMVCVDGVAVPVHQPVGTAHLYDGAVICLEAPRPRSSTRPIAELRAVGGPTAGGRWLLSPGEYRIGSDPLCEIHLSVPGIDPQHVVVGVGSAGEGFCEGVGSSSPVAVDGVVLPGRTTLAPGSLIRLGKSIWEFGSVHESAWKGSGQISFGVFNRPPRTQHPPAPVEVEVPERPAEPTAEGRPGWATLLVPLAMGALFAVLFSPMMATFALLGPMMMLANWFEDRRRVKKTRIRNTAEFSSALQKFGRDLKTAGAAHTRSLRTTLTEAPEVVSRALEAHPRLWERRPGHVDFMQVALGTGTVPWEPRFSDRLDDEETAAVWAGQALLEDAPVGIELRAGVVLGIAGRREVALALARWIVAQASIHQGPADLRVGVITDDPESWDWAKWLPHTATDPTSGRRLLGVTPGDIDEVLGHLAASPAPDGPAIPLTVLIADADSLDSSRRSRLRSVQAGSGAPVAGLVIAPSATDLPGLCNVVVEIPDSGGVATCRFPADGRVISNLFPTGVPIEIAVECSRALARLKDPEVTAEAADLPDMVPLTDLMSQVPFSVQAVLEQWDSAGPIPRLAGPVGATERGALVIDLVDDGPHGLIAGTTGSGKSELLRSLIVSLAASVNPDHLNFALIDYKGGSAFDACARLPHVVGVVTDLDAHLGRRALTCLEAELRYREARLREVEAADLPEYLATGPVEPLPRLVVVIDEFAAMAAELPGFVSSLVDIAQRGRSLGVHLLLATQRPAGVIGENIRANTNLRVALRVHDTADSRDVLDDSVAAAIPRGRAGRGYVRLGPGELIPFQAALVSTSHRPGGTVPVGVRAFRFGWEAADIFPMQERTDDQSTDLEHLVDVISAAADQAGIPSPRSPWPPELPLSLPMTHLVEKPGRAGPWWAPLGLVDEPHLQRQSIWGWEGSNLLVYGMPGSGPAQALLALGASLADQYQPDRIHIYALDFGTRTLAPLEGLPQVGSIIGSADRERQVRLLRTLQEEVAVRRAGDLGDQPAVVLLLDNYGGFSASFDHPTDLSHREALRRIVADGPGVGVFVAMSADQAAAVPTNLAALMPEKLVFRMADLFDYATVGLPNRELPDLPDGRAVQVGNGLVVQIADVSLSDLGRIAARAVSPGVTPSTIGVLPERSKIADMVHRASVKDREWFLPIGVGDRRLEPVGLSLGESDHALIAGPAKSGKSTALLAVSAIVASHRPDIIITAMAPRRSPLWEAPEIGVLVTDPDEIELVAQKILDDAAPQLILVDDADDLPDTGGSLLRLIRQRRPNIRVVGAGRADALRSMYGHWTQELRRCRQGIALRPQADVDGELWQTALPRHGPPVRLPGRGYLISDSGVELIQVAHP